MSTTVFTIGSFLLRTLQVKWEVAIAPLGFAFAGRPKAAVATCAVGLPALLCAIHNFSRDHCPYNFSVLHFFGAHRQNVAVEQD